MLAASICDLHHNSQKLCDARLSVLTHTNEPSFDLVFFLLVFLATFGTFTFLSLFIININNSNLLGRHVLIFNGFIGF